MNININVIFLGLPNMGVNPFAIGGGNQNQGGNMGGPGGMNNQQQVCSIFVYC